MRQPERFAPTTLGERLRERDRGWFAVTDAAHRADEHLRPHAHRYPAITIVRKGSFGVRLGAETIDCSDQGVLFKRGEHRHSNVVGREGARSLIVELRTDRDRVEGLDVPLPDETLWTGDPLALQLATRLALEFRAADSASELALEGIVLELVAVLVRRSCVPTGGARPSWLEDLIELLHVHFRETPSLQDLAQAVRRHPVHVARTFRRHQGCSPGEYMRSLRLGHAARALRDTDRSLGEIALEAGFYDQAHFCRSFKKEHAVTPSAYRSSFRARG